MVEKTFWVDPINSAAIRAASPELAPVLDTWLHAVSLRIGKNPFQIPTYTVATLPTATSWADTAFTSLVGVSDETGGYTVAFSDGTNWRRVQDRVIVS